MRLDEIFNRSFATWEWGESSLFDAVARFEIDSDKIEVGFNISYGDEVAAYGFQVPASTRFAEFAFSRNKKQKLTGTGNAIPILSTVAQICKEFVQEHNLQGIVFLASINEPSRVKLYNRICKKLDPHFQQELDGHHVFYLALV